MLSPLAPTTESAQLGAFAVLTNQQKYITPPPHPATRWVRSIFNPFPAHHGAVAESMPREVND